MEGGNQERPCLMSYHALGGDFVVTVFFTKIKMEEVIWKRCLGIIVTDAYKRQKAAG